VIAMGMAPQLQVLLPHQNYVPTGVQSDIGPQSYIDPQTTAAGPASYARASYAQAAYQVHAVPHFNVCCMLKISSTTVWRV
jgi:hypothetical protein